MAAAPDELADLLTAIASPVRLQIMRQLRTPQTVSSLRIVAGRSRKGEHKGRHLARATVHHHIDSLQAAGLIVRLPDDDGSNKFVLDHQRAFALVDEIRSLARLRSAFQASDGTTLVADDQHLGGLPQPPRLLLAYGRDDCVGYPLHEGKLWTIGRAPANAVSLDYDPFASATHATIHRTAAGFSISDCQSSNGTLVDGHLLKPGVEQPLRAGALIQVGRSILVFQGADP